MKSWPETEIMPQNWNFATQLKLQSKSESTIKAGSCSSRMNESFKNKILSKWHLHQHERDKKTLEDWRKQKMSHKISCLDSTHNSRVTKELLQNVNNCMVLMFLFWARTENLSPSLSWAKLQSKHFHWGFVQNVFFLPKP